MDVSITNSSDAHSWITSVDIIEQARNTLDKFSLEVLKCTSLFQIFGSRSLVKTTIENIYASFPFETSKKVDSEIRKIVDRGYERARKVLTEKIDDLHKLAKALLTYETLSGDEIENLINKDIYPPNKEDLKAENEDKGSALGSMGLKPKIVH